MTWIITTKTGYRHNRGIYNIVLLIAILLPVYIIYDSEIFGFEPIVYLRCEIPTCENPFYMYDPCTKGATWLYDVQKCQTAPENQWRKQRYLPQGEYGKKQHPLLPHLTLINIMLLLTAIVANHYTTNRGKKWREFDIEIHISKNKQINFREFEQKEEEAKP